MDKKFNWKRTIAVCLCLVFTWIAVCLWVFSYEIVELVHCPIEIPEIASILAGIVGMSCSCIAYEEREL